MATLGQTSPITSAFMLLGTDDCAVQKITIPYNHDAEVTNLKFYGFDAVGVDVDVKGVIWDSSYDVISNGVSTYQTVDTTTQWWTFTFPTNPVLYRNESYYIGIISSTNNIWLYGENGGGDWGYTADYENSYSSPNNLNLQYQTNYGWDIYITYTEIITGPSLLIEGTSNISSLETTSWGNITTIQ